MTDFHTALYKLIGEKVRDRRCDLGFSQEELSRKIDVISRASISNIEVGRHQAPLHVLSHISKALNTEMHFLLPTHSEVQMFIATSSEHDILGLLENKNLTEPAKNTLKSIINTL